MISVQWNPNDEHPESLAVALGALLRAAGRPRPIVEIASVLGLVNAPVAVRNECPRNWHKYGRDLCLGPACGLYGIRLRDLHPPDAAAGLADSAEFPAHFRESYVPLMERALAVNQPLFVWRGWPAPAELDWGVVIANRAGHLFGHCPGTGGSQVELSGTSHQVYVVEELPGPERPEPTQTAVENCRQAALDRFLNGSPPISSDLMIGAPALEMCRRLVQSQLKCARCGQPEADCAWIAQQHLAL